MKIMLSLFTLFLLCSFVFNSDLSLTSKTELTSETGQNFILNLMRSGESIYSRNGKYKLKMNEDCNLVLKEVKGKVLYNSGLKGKFEGCRAVLKRNSNFEIMTETKAIVWSTRTSNKYNGSSTYKLTVEPNANIMVRNANQKCVWALFGCPLPKAQIKKVQEMDPKKAIPIIKSLTKLIAKRLDVLPTKQLPLARNKPIITKQIPIVFKPVKPKPIKIKPLIKPQVFKGYMINKNSGVRKIVDKIRKFVPAKQVKKLIKLIQKGVSYNGLKKIAQQKMKTGYKKFTSSEKKVSNKKPPKLFTKKAINNTIKKTPWMKNIVDSIKRGITFKKIKTFLKIYANVIGTKKIWKKIKIAVKKKDYNSVTKIVSTPIKKKIGIPSINKNKKFKRRYELKYPAKSRWVLRYRTYLTFYWRYYYNYNYWVSHCWGWWWWRRCWWCRHANYSWYQHWYWTGYYYWSFE